MRRSGILWWIGAIVLAVLAGYFVFRALSAAVPAVSQRGDEGMVPVVVAVADIPMRRSITAEDLAVRELPADAVPSGAASAKEQVVGKMASTGFYAGEPVLLQKLVSPDIVTRELALLVPEGRIVLAVPTRSQLIANRLIGPGDHVDLLATFELEISEGGDQADEEKWAETVALLQNLEVHAIILGVSETESNGGQAVAAAAESVTGAEVTPEPMDRGGVFTTSDERNQSIVLAVPVQDAMTIRHVLDIGGVLDVALRPPDDESLPDTIPVDQAYMADRYQIDLTR